MSAEDSWPCWLKRREVLTLLAEETRSVGRVDRRDEKCWPCWPKRREVLADTDDGLGRTTANRRTWAHKERVN